MHSRLRGSFESSGYGGPETRHVSRKLAFKSLPTRDPFVNRGKSEHGFRMITIGISSTFPEGHTGNDVPTFSLRLYITLQSFLLGDTPGMCARA